MTGKLSARLTLSACEEIQSRMLEACREVAADYGLVFESAGWRDMTSGLSFEPLFRVSVLASDGRHSTSKGRGSNFWLSSTDCPPATSGANSTPAAGGSGS